ncbi:MAG: YncE family protein [Deltaproteobacteria bacterium]|nr:YncE family protein [Deltaproteobacteria bacterium]
MIRIQTNNINAKKQRGKQGICLLKGFGFLPGILLSFLLLLGLSACAGTPVPIPVAPVEPIINIEEPPVPIEGIVAEEKTVIEEKEPRELILRLFPNNAKVMANGEPLEPIRRENDLAWYLTSATQLGIESNNYAPLSLFLPEMKDVPAEEVVILEAKLEAENLPLELETELPTGIQPKSVRFSSDGKYLYVAHLAQTGAISRYKVEPFELDAQWNVPESWAEDKGFVETLLLPERGELWVTQMTRDVVHVFDSKSGLWLEAIETDGSWPKVLALSPDKTMVYISCWVSQSISEIDVDKRKVTRKFSVSGIPRGLAFSPNGEELLVTIFSSSAIDRINLKSGKLTESHIPVENTKYAMRHIVWDKYKKIYYITAMGKKRVYKMTPEGVFSGYWDVGEKPNTCAISPDGNWLFVSCRGPNNPDKGYLVEGYEYGKVYIINLKTDSIQGWIWGRDQTTGLDISPDGRWLAFTDFLDQNLEIYRINP